MANTICMLVTNPVTNDPRVRREASSLRKSGFRVVIVGVKTDDRTNEDSIDDCPVLRVAHPKWILSRVRLRYAPAGEQRELRNGRETAQPFMPESGWATRSLWGDFLNIVNVLWLNLAIVRVAIRQKANVYHAHDLDTLLAGVLAKRLTGAKLVYDFHELFTEQYREGTKTWMWKRFYARLEKRLIAHADLKLTVCDSIARWISSKYSTTPSVIVRNCPPVHDTKKVCAGPKREKVVLYHGAYVHDRGIEQLIECSQYLSHARVVLRGVGQLESHFRALVLQKGLEKKVTFAPPVSVSQLVAAASAADIGVALYLPTCLNAKFSLPNKIFEYMMAGLAIVGSDLPEIRQVILGSRSAIGAVCNPQDPHDLARAINRMTEDDGLLERLKRQARAAALSIYNWETEGQRLLHAYEALNAG